ncbi:MAG: hypothetical protein C0617_11225 [Desulfuromonas sp.]|mgnify:CR=1 FL=1|uniref:hypothetical protein n=1 Tax=Desulfuromonas sp. TaxID=892 RepID=UPI000CC3B580|nr:hypothetical protein [Desulfuromonas sp.]PLX83493.1 MAG: hypothetical protein C0617_11225 [Desulfuromonas sp.]
MGEQKIEKNRRRVLFTLADGSDIEGTVFLSLYEMHRLGPQRVGELLNGEDAFIPVETAEGLLHLNVANISVARTDADGEVDELMTLGRRYPVEVTTLHGPQVRGEVCVNLPDGNCRVRDFLNQPLRFFPLFLPGEVAYLNPCFVLSVRD